MKAKTFLKDKNIYVALISVFVFGLIAHGYRFVDLAFGGDSMLMIVQDDYLWQVSLGRFMQPLLLMLRGGMETPLLIGFLSMLWIGLSALIIIRMLNIKSYLGIILTAGIMVCNTVLTSANAAFLGWLDLYAVALFLAVLGVRLIDKDKIWQIILGILCIALSLGTYQSYLFVAVGLMMFIIIRELYSNSEIKKTLLKALRYVASLLIGGGIYYLLWKLILKMIHLDAAESYNGIADVGNYSNTSIFGLIGLTYKKFFEFLCKPGLFIHPDMEGRLAGSFWPLVLLFANILIFLMIIELIVIINMITKKGLWAYILQALIVIFLPFGLGGVAFISKGLIHPLMIYGSYMIYIFFIAVMEDYLQVAAEKAKDIHLSLVQIMVMVLLGILIWNNIVYSNQVYLKRALQENVVKTTMTSILDDIKEVEGYVPGITPVAFYGDLDSNEYIFDIDGTELLTVYGMGKTSLSYQGTDYAYIKYYTSERINLTRAEYNNPDVLAMPQYPNQGSIGFVGDVLVIKLSD